MNNNLKQVIQNIAEIQLEALKRIQKDPRQYDNFGLVQFIQSSEIDSTIQNRIDYWERVYSLPCYFKTLDQYQLGICSHILFTMESEWVQANPEGVLECWDLIDNCFNRHHPEVKLLNLDLWKRKNSSST